MNKFGYSEEKAKFICDAHRKLYKAYYDYIDKELDKAKLKGYVTLAFGLRLRTPKLVLGTTSGVPKYELESEERSTGNALFQSYGLMTLRALSDFMRRVWSHPEFSSDIILVSTVYDSIYLDVPNDLEIVHWVNVNLVECMKNTSHIEELEHVDIPIGAELEIMIGSWASPLKLKNGISENDILETVKRNIR
jgi:DNA polymerase-1